MKINFNTFIFILIIINSFIFVTKIINKKNKIKIPFTKKNIIINKIINYFINLLQEIFPTLIIIFILRSFFYEPFKIPSASMMPTLLIGDFILVEKFSYNIKNPITDKTIIYTSQPKYGDIIVFKYPKNKNINYIKRVIGLPTDKIVYNEKNKEIKIYKLNGKKYLLDKKIITYNSEQNSEFVEEIRFLNNNIQEFFWKKNSLKYEKINSIFLNLIEKNEKINKINHKVLLIPNILLKYIYQNNNIYKIKTWIVPKNMYFVMGDYRDNSNDSRYWGFVHKDNLIGKAKYIWMSLEQTDYNWFFKIRFNRIGKIF